MKFDWDHFFEEIADWILTWFKAVIILGVIAYCFVKFVPFLLIY